MLDCVDVLAAERSDPSIINHLKRIERLLGYNPVNDSEEVADE